MVSRSRMLGDASCAERLEREAPLHGAGGGWREEGEVCRGGRMSMMDRARGAERGLGVVK